MSEKINIYMDKDIVHATGSESASGQITRALKSAFVHSDDFIQYARIHLTERSHGDGCPDPEELVDRGALRYNFYGEFGGIKLFAAKGSEAEIKKGSLKIGEVVISLSDCALKWGTRENDFNEDEICVIATPAEDIKNEQ